MKHSTSEQNRVGLKFFFNLMSIWSQSSESQMKLLNINDAAKFNELFEEKSTDISHEQLTRISYMIKIHRYLRTIFTNEKQADSWINRANKQYENLTASEYMQLNGIEGIENVCLHLHAHCH